MVGISINNQYSCTTNITPNDLLWNGVGDNYIFESDMKFVKGTDHNIVFRFIYNPPNIGISELHFQSPGDFTVSVPVLNYNVFIPNSYPNAQTYHIKSVINNKNIKIYINNLLVRDITMPTKLPSGKIALRAGTGSDPNSETWFDNVKVTSIDSDLDVPLLKQTDPLWKNNIYDSANLWSPNAPTIHNWGCALTSAAMVFQYHGLKKLPDGTSLDPGSLNSWLKSQSDGYIGNGLLNWLSLSRLSKQAKNINNITTFDALEYERIKTSNNSVLSNDINNGIADILEEPGHFIVAKGINNSTFNINDPFYNRSTLDDGYSSTFLSLRRYTPSNTDLSYIMAVANPEINILLKDSNGNQKGEQFIQDPLDNDEDTNQKNGPPIKMFYFKKPTNDQYQTELSSLTDKNYDLSIYLYDINGNVKILNFTGFIGQNTKEIIDINFNRQNSDNSSAEKIVTFQGLIEDINEAKFLNLINKSAANSLLAIAKNAKKQYENDRRKIAITQLNALKKLLNSYNKIPYELLIKMEAYRILLYDVDYLIFHI